MADDTSKTETSETTAQTEGETVAFSAAQQEMLNKIISERLNAQTAKHAKETADLISAHKRELEMARMDDAARAKAEQEDAIAGLTKRAEDAEHMLRIVDAQRRLAEAGLPVELADTVLGKDGDDTAARVALLSKTVDERANKLYSDKVRTGAPSAPTGSPADAVLAKMRKAARL